MKDNIKNIIFDLGGVILNLDISATTKAFVALADHSEADLEGLKTEPAYLKLETGEYDTRQFCQAVQKHYSRPPADLQVIEAWNAMVLDIPKERLDFLLELKKKYRTFLFSNTNEIHVLHYNAYLKRHYGVNDLQPYFEKLYYSHVMHLAKPDPASFAYLLRDSGLLPGETLFVDDTQANVEAASNMGIRGFHLNPPMKLTDLKDLLL